MPPGTGGIKWDISYLLLFSHFWFATPQEVLQADWQEVWHSPWYVPLYSLWTTPDAARTANVSCKYDNTVSRRCQVSRCPASGKAGSPVKMVCSPSSRARCNKYR